MKIVDLVRGDLTKLERATVGALVVMDVHARDVVTKLVADNVTSATDFSWQAQLRTSWEVDVEVRKEVVEAGVPSAHRGRMFVKEIRTLSLV